MNLIAGTAALVVALNACSFGMKTLAPQYDGTSEPDCNDSVAAIAAEVVMAGILGGIGIAAADGTQGTSNEVLP